MRATRSARSPTPAGCACSTATSWSATCRWRRSSTTARSTTSSPRSRRADLPRPARAARRRTRRGGAARAARLAQRRLEALRLRAVRPDRRLAHRAAPRGGGRRRGAHARPDGGTGAIAVSIDGNGRRVACDPYTGAVEAVLECARNLACVGAEPLGLTNCLNFGNPEKPHVAWQLTRAVEGLRDACLALGVPGGGRQRLPLQRGRRGPIYPTPIVGMVGQAARPGARRRDRASPRRATRSRSSARSRPRWRARSSRSCGAAVADALPAVDLDARPPRSRRCAAVRAGALATVHDVSEGGLACALAECCIAGGIGARDARPRRRPDGRRLFGEGPGGVDRGGARRVERRCAGPGRGRRRPARSPDGGGSAPAERCERGERSLNARP